MLSNKLCFYIGRLSTELIHLIDRKLTGIDTIHHRLEAIRDILLEHYDTESLKDVGLTQEKIIKYTDVEYNQGNIDSQFEDTRIDAIFNQSCSRQMNGIINIEREKYLSKWFDVISTKKIPKGLQLGELEYIQMIDEEFKRHGIEIRGVDHTGGRRHSFDFLVYGTTPYSSEIREYKIEFKCGKPKDIERPWNVQLGQVYTKTSRFTKGDFVKEYYHYLDSIIEKYSIQSPKPEYQSYWNKISTTNIGPSDSFYKELKTLSHRKGSGYIEDQDRFIHSFLEMNPEPSVEEIQKYLDAKLSVDKDYFLVWTFEDRRFTLYKSPRMRVVDVKLKMGIKGYYVGYEVVCEEKRKPLLFRLRWKNGKGVLNPAWQIE